jgi:hypothetical protein
MIVATCNYNLIGWALLDMRTLDAKHVFTWVTNFYLGKLKFWHVWLHSFALLPTMNNEKRRSILFHIWQPINSCITKNQDCQHTYLILYTMWCKLEGMFGQIPHQPTHPYISRKCLGGKPFAFEQHQVLQK